MDLHENQCRQPKHEIDAAGWLGRSGRGEKEEEAKRGVKGRRWGRGVHQSPPKWVCILLSWAWGGRGGGSVLGSVGGVTR